jgi:HD superfamily phosphohydrolase
MASDTIKPKYKWPPRCSRVVVAQKIVHDPVHGSIRVSGLNMSLLDSAELQRLAHIKQLGLANLVFPGANHTRLEHSLGACHIADRLARELELDEEDRTRLTAAAILHDVGHGPFSHTLEGAVFAELGFDHVEHSRRIIMGEEDALPEGDREELGSPEPVSRLMEEVGLDPAGVATLLEGGKGPTIFDFAPDGNRIEGLDPACRHLRQIIHGVVDVDQIDYLMRDSHYTGVAHGVIDVDRLLQTLVLADGELAVKRGGVSALEGMLVARGLMYSSVYFHKTARIAELMLARTVERNAEPELLHRVMALTDGELFAELATQDVTRDTLLRLKYRRLHKAAYQLTISDATEEQRETMMDLSKPTTRRAMEDELARRAGLDEGLVVVDVPAAELLLSEPRLYTTHIRVWDEGELHPLSKFSPLARALQQRTVTQWGLLVACPKEAMDKVAAAAERTLAP